MHILSKKQKNGTATYLGSVTSHAKNAPGLIDSPNDVKPAGTVSAWPELSDGGVKASDIMDSDGDGIPDFWEKAHQLNPNNAADGNAVTLSREGYTNMEFYMNSLVKVITDNQNNPL